MWEYRKGYNIKQALVSFKTIWSDKSLAGEALIDFEKAFDISTYEFLITKLNVYICNRDSLKLINYYLSDRCQRTRTIKSFNFRAELPQRTPQGSVMDPVFFNICHQKFFIKLNVQKSVILQMSQHLFLSGKDSQIFIVRLEMIAI